MATVNVGAVQPLRVAITPDGAFAYVTLDFPNTVSVIETATNTVVTTVPVGSRPFGVAITPDGAFAYVANFQSGTVSVIATATNTVVATVSVGANPDDVAITPDGAFAYVTKLSSTTVSVIATATNTVVATVGVGINPRGVAITPDGAFAYVTNLLSGTVSVIATASNTVVATIGGFSRPAGIAITPLLTPEQQLESIKSDVADLESGGSLNRGQANALTVKLDRALGRLEGGHIGAAINLLNAFINQVTGLITGAVLTSAEGQPLIDAANNVIADLAS